MEILHELELNREVHIKNSSYKPQDRGSTCTAGLVFDGKLAWKVVGSSIRVISVESGAEVAYLDIEHHRECPPIVTAIAEIKFYQDNCVLAIAIDYKCPGGFPIVKIFSVQGSKVICTWDFSERITCMYDIEQSSAIQTSLLYERGTLIVGTEKGKIFCFDLQLPINTKALHKLQDSKSELSDVVYDNDCESFQNARSQVISLQESDEKSVYFAFQLEDLKEDGNEEIHSIVLLPLACFLAVGLSEGRMILYDMRSLQIQWVVEAPRVDAEFNKYTLCCMTTVEPVDDPEYFIYVLAVYKSKLEVKTVLFALEFKGCVMDDEGGAMFYEKFVGAHQKIVFSIGEGDLFPIGAQTISKPVKPDDDDMMKLCILSFRTIKNSQVKVIVFDLNKYYSEWCPRGAGDVKDGLSYAPVFIIDERLCWAVHFDEHSVSTFDSFERAPEHTMPLSLSFDITVLGLTHIRDFQWRGLQTKAIAQYNLVGPLMILEPSYYFKEMLDAFIKPKFSLINYRMSTEIEKKREFLLTIALEYNQLDFLKKCIWAWSDGSMLSAKPSTGVSLSTMTNWIWRRVQMMKDYCNTMCMPLFDFSGNRIDGSTQKWLSACCRQLKNLSDLLQIIMKDHRKYIPDEIYASLEQKARSIQVNSDYQEVLQWLLNVGLLPEGKHNHLLQLTGDEEFIIVPYPFEVINSHYKASRKYIGPTKDFYEEGDDRKYLYIDAFIANECGDQVEKEWQSNYPPKTIQALLRTLLIEDLSIEKKGIIFIYFFMDMANILNNTAYSNIVKNLIKFPTVFNINSAVIKQTQAYWHLDNGNFNMAVDEAISPLANERIIPQWMRELMLCVLLKYEAFSLALKVLRCPGTTIRPVLELAVLLYNNLYNEAYFHQQKCDRTVKDKFLEFLIQSGEQGIFQLLGISFDEEEAKIFHEHLEKSGLSKTFNIHFVSLIKESKYTEAANLVEKIEKVAEENAIDMEPSKHILGAFMSLLDTTTQKITQMTSSNMSGMHGVTFPETFSASVIMNGGSASRNIYKRCIESISHATSDVNVTEKEEKMEVPFLGYPKLGIFEYRRQQRASKNLAIPIDVDDLDVGDVNANGKRKLEVRDDREGKTKRMRINEIKNDADFNSFLGDSIDKRINFLRPASPPESPDLVINSRPPKAQSAEFKATMEMIMNNSSMNAETSQNLDVTPEFDYSEKENLLEKFLTPSPSELLKQRASSLRVTIACPTPKDVKLFTETEDGYGTDTLSTPIIKKRLPFQNIALPAAPPTSILKTCSDRGSVSPTPSCSSQITTKSVKSITFAEMKESRESSFANEDDDDDDEMESSCGGAQEQMDSSNEKFYSPEKASISDVIQSSPSLSLLITQGVKARPGINATSTTNMNVSARNSLNETVVSSLNSSSPCFDIFEPEEAEDDEEEEEEHSSIFPNDSDDILCKKIENDQFVRLKQFERLNKGYDDNDESSKTSDKDFDDDEIADDEHFEEEELPEHSDYDEDAKCNGIEIDSSESSNQSFLNPPAKTQNDVIEIEDSEDDVVISEPTPLTINLPSFNAVQSEIQQATDFIELEIHGVEEQVIDTMTYQTFDVEAPLPIESPVEEVEIEKSLEETAIEGLLGLKNNEPEATTSEIIVEQEPDHEEVQPVGDAEKDSTVLDSSAEKDELCDNEVQSLFGFEEFPAEDLFKKLQFSKNKESATQSTPQKARPFSVPAAVEENVPKKRPMSEVLADKDEKDVTNQPLRITRSQSRLLSQESRGLTPQPQTPTRSQSRAGSEISNYENRGQTPQPHTPTSLRTRSRAASEISDSAKKTSRRGSTDVQTTPLRKKSTRSYSRESLNNDETMEEPRSKTPRRDRDRKKGSDDGETSRILEEPSASTRRTTRSQLSILQDKSISISSTMSPKRSKKSQNTKNEESGDDSGDNESVTSSVSSTRTTRKRKSSTKSDSTAPKRKSPTKDLAIIPEENTEEIQLIAMSAQKQKKK